MKTETLQSDYARFRKSGAMIYGFSALWAWKDANTLAQFREHEEAGLVRIVAEPEQENYFDVYGEPDDEKDRAEMETLLERYGCWVVFAQIALPNGCWETVDSVGMNTGYADPTDPFENCYVPQMMRAALAHVPQQGEH